MPETRLQKTREGKPEVPPCVRLGHFTFYQAHTDEYVCRRCGLRRDGRSGAVRMVALPKSGHTDFGFEVTEPAPDSRPHSHRFVYSPADLALRCACGEQVSSQEALNEASR
jgi:ribosomal protein S27AE